MSALLVISALLAIIGSAVIFYNEDSGGKIAGIILWTLGLFFSFVAGHNGAAGKPTDCERGVYQLVALDRQENPAHILVRDKERQPRLFKVPGANLHRTDQGMVRITKDEDDKCHVYPE